MASLSQVTIEKRNGCLWVLMPRFIDGKNTLTIESDINNSLDDSIDRVVLDLTNVLSISSVAMGLIIRLRAMISELTCSIYFINISDYCREQLATVNLDKILPVIQ